MAESFVKMIKRDYAAHMLKLDREMALRNLAIAFEHYNEQYPHSALQYRSPREFRRLAHQFDGELVSGFSGASSTPHDMLSLMADITLASSLARDANSRVSGLAVLGAGAKDRQLFCLQEQQVSSFGYSGCQFIRRRFGHSLHVPQSGRVQAYQHGRTGSSAARRLDYQPDDTAGNSTGGAWWVPADQAMLWSYECVGRSAT